MRRPTGTDSKKVESKKGITLILAGLVLAGIAAGYNWVRSLPKD